MKLKFTLIILFIFSFQGFSQIQPPSLGIAENFGKRNENFDLFKDKSFDKTPTNILLDILDSSVPFGFDRKVGEYDGVQSLNYSKGKEAFIQVFFFENCVESEMNLGLENLKKTSYNNFFFDAPQLEYDNYKTRVILNIMSLNDYNPNPDALMATAFMCYGDTSMLIQSGTVSSAISNGNELKDYMDDGFIKSVETLKELFYNIVDFDERKLRNELLKNAKESIANKNYNKAREETSNALELIMKVMKDSRVGYVSITEQYAEVFTNVAQLEAINGKYDKAIETINVAINTRENVEGGVKSAFDYYLRGFCKAKQGDLADACNDVKTAFSITKIDGYANLIKEYCN